MADYLLLTAPVLLGVVLLTGVGYLAFAWPAWALRRNLRYVGNRPGPRSGEVILCFTTRHGEPREYRGHCTVWYTVPEGQRCNVQTECFLFETWTLAVEPGSRATSQQVAW